MVYQLYDINFLAHLDIFAIIANHVNVHIFIYLILSYI